MRVSLEGYPDPENGVIYLPNLPLEDGWLGQSEDFSTNTPENNITIKGYEFPYIAPYGSYTDEVANASWMPSEDAAMAYRSFSAYTGPEIYDGLYRNGPLAIENLESFSCFNSGETIEFTVNPRDFDETRTIEKMELYLDADLMAQDTDESNGWGFNITQNAERGVHGLVVVATALNGDKTSCFRAILIDDPPE